MADTDLLTLARDISRRCELRGEYVLKSGRPSQTYFDKYAFESDPVLLGRIVNGMVPQVPAGTDLLGGLELGGIPLATLLSAATGIPAVFVRKQAKTYGTERIVEGADAFGKSVLLVDDVITSGGAVRDAAIALRAEGARVDRVLCAVDRRDPESTALSDQHIAVSYLITSAMLTSADRSV